MNPKIICALGLTLLLGCSHLAVAKNENSPDKTHMPASDSMENAALKQLFEKLSTLQNASIKGDQIFMGDTSIRLKINVEFDGPKDGKWIYAANISTIYEAGKVTQITIGSLGVGSTKKEARTVCIREWFMVFGVPFTNMLAGGRHLREENMDLFPGLMGVRGSLPENTWLTGDDEMNKRIFSKIREQLKKEHNDIIPVDIKLLIGKNGIADGECRVNNQVSSQLLESLKQLNWPSSDEAFLFKQFYLISKANK